MKTGDRVKVEFEATVSATHDMRWCDIEADGDFFSVPRSAVTVLAPALSPEPEGDCIVFDRGRRTWKRDGTWYCISAGFYADWADIPGVRDGNYTVYRREANPDA